MTQLVIEGTIPRELKGLADKANAVLKLQAKKKALMRAHKEADESLTAAFKEFVDEHGAKKGAQAAKELRILGFNLVLDSKERVKIVPMDEDADVREAKSDAGE